MFTKRLKISNFDRKKKHEDEVLYKEDILHFLLGDLND